MNVLLNWVFIPHSLHVHSEKLTQNRLRRLNIRVPFVNVRLYIHLQLYMLRLFQRTYNTYHPHVKHLRGLSIYFLSPRTATASTLTGCCRHKLRNLSLLLVLGGPLDQVLVDGLCSIDQPTALGHFSILYR